MNHLHGKRSPHRSGAGAAGARVPRARLALAVAVGAACAALLVGQAPGYVGGYGGYGLPGVRHSSASTLANGTSSNWGGEIAEGARFTSVRATWTVPTVSCRTDESNAGTYAWVGLGGWDGRQALEQVGTAHWCDAGRPTYGLFGEFYSSPPFAGDGGVFKPRRYPVRPGDVVTATVSKVNDRGRYELDVVNATEYWHFTRDGRSPDFDASSDPGNLTGEVITEPPGDTNPRYTPTTFTDISYTSRGGSPTTGLFDTVPARGRVERTTRLSADSIRTTWLGY